MLAELLLLFFLFSSTMTEENCERLVDMEDYESKCFEDNSEFFEQLKYRANSFFNMAKKKLGFSTEESDGGKVKKCGYYECIFHVMNVLNQYNIPDKKLLKEWLFSRVDEATKVKYNEVIDTCFNTLLYDLENGLQFKGELAKNGTIKANERDISNTKSTNNQKTCEIATELLICLNTNEKCPIFRYP